jgi:sulfate adenylyltransferase subunit 1 (EFTu-like GTPase family)
VVEQTRRHIVIAALLRVPRLTVAVNKMDLVEFDEARFRSIAADVAGFAGRLGVREVSVLPVSALCGDNVVERSVATPWYDGPPLLEHLESVGRDDGAAAGPFRLPIQWVIRSRDDGDYRAVAGRIASGRLRPGDRVAALPSRIETRVKAIDTFDGPLEDAAAPRSVAVRLADDVDLGRGGMLAAPDDVPPERRRLDALVCWLGGTPLTAGRRYRLQQTSRSVRAVASDLSARLDINTLEWDADPTSLAVNEVGRVALTLAEPIFADAYARDRTTGSAILLDEATNETVGAVLIQDEGRVWP